MDKGVEEHLKDLTQNSVDQAETKSIVEDNACNIAKKVTKTFSTDPTKPKKRRRQPKEANILSPAEASTPEVLSSTRPPDDGAVQSPKTPYRKRKRIKREADSQEGNSADCRRSVWGWKAVGQLNSFLDWIHSHEPDDDILIENLHPSSSHQDSFSVAPDSSEIRTAIENTESGVGLSLVSPFTRANSTLEITVTAKALPEIDDLVKASSLGKDGLTDIASFVSNGCLRSINFRIARWLVATRKSVRLELNQGPWPAKNLLINPAAVQALTNRRFQHLMDLFLTSIEHCCCAEEDVQLQGKAIVCLRLGLDVGPEEHSLIVCATGVSSKLAKFIASKIWKRVLQVALSETMT